MSGVAKAGVEGLIKGIVEAVLGSQEASAGAFVQLHTGDPDEGEAGGGENNQAAENSKVLVILEKKALGGGTSDKAFNEKGIEWVEVIATETYTHFSLWVQPEVGVFVYLGSGALTEPVPVEEGDTFRIPAEKLTIEII